MKGDGGADAFRRSRDDGVASGSSTDKQEESMRRWLAGFAAALIVSMAPTAFAQNAQIAGTVKALRHP